MAFDVESWLESHACPNLNPSEAGRAPQGRDGRIGRAPRPAPHSCLDSRFLSLRGNALSPRLKVVADRRRFPRPPPVSGP